MRGKRFIAFLLVLNMFTVSVFAGGDTGGKGNAIPGGSVTSGIAITEHNYGTKVSLIINPDPNWYNNGGLTGTLPTSVGVGDGAVGFVPTSGGTSVGVAPVYFVGGIVTADENYEVYYSDLNGANRASVSFRLLKKQLPEALI